MIARTGAALAAAALAALAGAGCAREQPFAAAMKILCDGPVDELSRPPSRIRNRQARALLAKGVTEPGHRFPASIDQAARRAGLERCRVLEAMGPVLPFDPPSASGQVLHGGVMGPLLVIGTDAILLDRREIVRLESGKVPDGAMSDDGLGPIRPLVVAFDRWERPRLTGEGMRPGPGGGGVGVFITLLVAPSASYQVAWQAIESARSAGMNRLVVLVIAPDGSLGALEPQRHAAEEQLARRAAEVVPVQLVVSLDDRKLVLWSTSGLEGTLDGPRLELAARPDSERLHRFDASRLSAALAAIADARWPDGVPPPLQRTIVVQAAPGTPFQTIVDVMVAARARADGRELFPEGRFEMLSFDRAGPD